jgi:hypothetical protein
MSWLASLALSMSAALGQTPAPTEQTPPAPVVMSAPMAYEAPTMPGLFGGAFGPNFLKGDTDFPRFIYPVSNPVYAKDPRATTHVRGLYIHNTIDPNNPLGGGNFDAAAAQVNVAVNERLTILADKDGYLWLNPGKAPSSNGFLNIGAGLKYAFIRDIENQYIMSGGFMYEIPSGDRGALSGHGDGSFAFFLINGKEFNERWHLLNTTGYNLPVNGDQNSAFFYTSFHIDYQVSCWLYPLAELNWFHYTAGGNRGIAPGLGEGDGLVNIGTSGVAGNDLVTAAFGGRAVLSEHISIGLAWEVPLSNRHDLIDNRILMDLIFRY